MIASDSKVWDIPAMLAKNSEKHILVNHIEIFLKNDFTVAEFEASS